MPDGTKPAPGGWNRIHLIVTDIAAEVAQLRAAGLPFRNDIVSGPGGQQILLEDRPATSSHCSNQPADDPLADELSGRGVSTYRETTCGGRIMAKLLYSATMSLDGYIAGPGGDMSWLTEHLTGENPTVDRLLANVGALLTGNATYGGDDPNRGTDSAGPFGGRYRGPVFVVAHRPPTEPPPGVTFLDDLHSAVAQAKEAAGYRYVNILGANVAKQCLAEGMLDEVLVFIAPVLLGDGVRLFDHPGGTNVRLTPVPGESAHWYSIIY